MVEFLDFDQAAYYLETIERKIKFDNLLVDDAARFRMWLLFVKVSILRQDIPKALEICEDLEKSILPERKRSVHMSRII